MKWVALSSRELGKISRRTICVLPLGATEQHGPHLPLATDQTIASSLAEKLDCICADQLLLLPPLPATCSQHHMAFPGTLTLEHETFKNVVIQLVLSACRHGFTRFFLLNAHGGNVAIGGVIVDQLKQIEPTAEVVFGTWFQIVGEKLRHLVEGTYPAVGHACEFETSLMLALQPESVAVNAIVDDGQAPPSPVLNFDLLKGGPAARAYRFEEISSNGVWGKPSLATAEKGRAILHIVVPTLQQLLHAYWPDAPGLESQLSLEADRPRAAVIGSGEQG